MKNSVAKIIITIAFLLESSASFAQVIDSSFYRWTVYEMQGEDELEEKKCYIVSFPVKTDSNNEARQKPYIMITRFQNRRIEEISVSAGFEYKINSQVLLSIDDKKFQIPTNGDMAWAKNKNDDVAIIQKILQSAVVKVRSDSAIGTFAIDEYSLKGVTKAYLRMREVCK